MMTGTFRRINRWALRILSVALCLYVVVVCIFFVKKLSLFYVLSFLTGFFCLLASFAQERFEKKKPGIRGTDAQAQNRG